MKYEVNQRMNPERRSNRESNVEAITAIDLLSIEAYTLDAKRTMFAMFEMLIAILSLFAMLFNSSCK